MITFSFIIPVKPGGYIKALDALRLVPASSPPFEVLIAEGCSPSLQRNSAANESRGEILYFLDDDSLAAHECLDICAAIMTDTAVAVVGGPSLTPPDDSQLQRLFGLALSSLFGAGGMRNRYRAAGGVRETTDKELILCNLAIRRSVFMESGGLDERLYPNEENELLDRIQASGHKLLHAPDMAIHRSQRRTIRQFIRQMFSYGRGRAQQTLIAGSGSPVGFIPLLFVLYLALLPFVTASPLLFAPLWLYGTLDAVFTATAIASSGSVAAAALLALFPLMHVSNGLGLLYGLIRGKNGRPASGEQLTVSVRRVKEFGQQTW